MLQSSIKKGYNVSGAEQVGKLISEKMKASKIKDFYFDRGGLAYHGRVKALADSVRKNGFKF